ncbi:glycosyl hydrolase [Penicillium waksmanii]|uniref:glycosyl hydrolase n=1 Tax=Penicillium waksmanii TaxID=69791 RepID=UPI002548CFCD|nr:glycosyl hydrolase [Penicillium waksmanii]KAJ5980604.1 glycosyl hydrolase [Penicillium waksmanii]
MTSTLLFSVVSAILMNGFSVAQPTRVIDSDFADPCVIQTGDGYYAFATSGNGVNVQIASSSNFASWQLLSGNDAMPGPFPSWVASTPAIWAPDVIQRDDGTFVMYFSASSADDDSKHCVGAATSSSITGPYTPEDSPLACPLDQGGAIDADGFKDGDTYYVVYKVDGNSIQSDSTPLMLQGLNSDAVTPNGDPTQLLDRDDADGPLIEAPSLAKVDGTFYLTFSSNVYSTKDYDVSYATAPALKGPYTKAQAPDAPLLVSGDSSDVGELGGPGGSDFNADGSKIVFHAFENGENMDKGRAMWVADIHCGDGVISIL